MRTEDELSHLGRLIIQALTVHNYHTVTIGIAGEAFVARVVGVGSSRNEFDKVPANALAMALGLNVRICRECRQPKDFPHGFPVHPRYKDGRKPICLQCEALRIRLSKAKRSFRSARD